MDWSSLRAGFSAYLRLEKSASDHTLAAYLADLDKLMHYAALKLNGKSALHMTANELEDFLCWLQQFQLGNRSQARILSGIKAFYKFLLVEDLLQDDPTERLEGPKLARKLPDTLSAEEISLILQSIDLSSDHGHRNRAMLETMYACGLRVSELCALRISDISEREQCLSVIGKGNKQRLVPIGGQALKQINYYKNHCRSRWPVARGHEDILFLNRFGKKISRVSVFEIVREACIRAGIRKEVSPHTFRHSFATHLVEGGANLRAVQEMLGHESITTTEIYTHLDLNYLRETILQFHPTANRRWATPRFSS